jgi:hypothetical protein
VDLPVAIRPLSGAVWYQVRMKIGRGSPASRVIRQWPRLPWVLAGFAALALGSIMWQEAQEGDAIWFYPLMFVPVAVGVWSFARTRVEIHEDACRIVNPFSSATIPWKDIERFSLEQGVSLFDMGAYCVRRDGSRVEIRAIEARKWVIRWGSSMSPDLVIELNRLLKQRQATPGSRAG